MDLQQAIITRRSARAYLDTPVPDEALREMMEAARHAPSPGNSQGYRFGIIKDQTLRRKLAKAAGQQMWIAGAPVTIACCADASWDIRDMPEEDFGRQVNLLRFGKQFMEYLCAYPDRIARTTFFENATPLIPMEHIFLTAVAHGLHACIVGYLDVEQASRILSLPDTLRCLFLMPIGYAAQPPGEKSLRAIADITFADRWDAR